MTTPSLPAAVAVTTIGTERLAEHLDLVCGGQAVASGQYLAGLILAAQLDTAGTPQQLIHDLHPDVDPVERQEIWDRGLAVGIRVAALMLSPRRSLTLDELRQFKAQLEEVGHAAMTGMVARSAGMAAKLAPAHPVDEEEARGH